MHAHTHTHVHGPGVEGGQVSGAAAHKGGNGCSPTPAPGPLPPPLHSVRSSPHGTGLGGSVGGQFTFAAKKKKRLETTDLSHKFILPQFSHV